MLSGLLSFLSGFLVKFLTEALADWRRDKALEAKGSAEATAKINQETADANRRMAESNAQPRTADDVLDRLRRGDA